MDSLEILITENKFQLWKLNCVYNQQSEKLWPLPNIVPDLRVRRCDNMAGKKINKGACCLY